MLVSNIVGVQMDGYVDIVYLNQQNMYKDLELFSRNQRMYLV